MNLKKFLAYAVTSCSTSLLLSYISRLYIDVAVVILLLRMLFFCAVGWFIYHAPDKYYKALCGCVWCGMLIGWLIGYRDDITLVWKYQSSSLILPIAVVAVVILLGFFGYEYFKIKAK